ncbi:MAG: bifunctional DNA-formamidopyrimidine glycosylase/DNA-(apurinic or apyrimidinic site) lyase [Gammaproteobacteria bacterium]|nr:bifunctional DNA-formamidopyrimidine glycosylase/DNA-(apurinic or apyrimidinic site) lyase [Gammaproteobacteria bacterium]
MPELPEVETTRRGLMPWMEGHRIRRLVLRNRQLRWPVPEGLEELLRDAPVRAIGRRGKYLLLETPRGTALVHLGMSGSLRVLEGTPPAGRHEHFDILLDDGHCIRFTDPRRFGALLWAGTEPLAHPLLARLGPEPLEAGFSGDYLWQRARRRRMAIKPFLMDAGIVVGVGNIYASEALFAAGLSPRRAAGRISRADMARLVAAVRAVLERAIAEGGTTLRDFRHGTGEPGYFAQELAVYGREGQACPACGSAIRRITQGQRSSFFCPACQR